MNEKPEKEVSYLSPLKRICMTIGELPSSYLETMSYYEMLVWFTKFLQERVIPTIDNNALAVKELQSLFELLRTYVNDYFDNLDVQEEINNKLDQMLEDGILEQIIEQYLNSSALWCFDNVASMKEATNLIDGSYAKTLGYYSANDGGGATYKITDTESEEEYQEELENSLYATLIIEVYVTPEMFGAYGDNEHDDKNKIQNALNISSLKKCNLIFNDKTYLISNYLNIPSDSKIKGNKSKIHCSEYTSSGNQPIFNFNNVNNISIENIELYSNMTQTDSRGQITSNRNAFSFTNSNNITINNCKGKYLHSFIWISQLGEDITHDIKISNCECFETHEPLYTSNCYNLYINNIISGQCDDSTSYCHHMYINSNSNDIFIDNWVAKKTCNVDYGYMINVADSISTGKTPKNIIINNFECNEENCCSFLAVSGGNTSATNKGSVFINNCHITKAINKNYGGYHKRQVVYSGTFYDTQINNSSFIGFTNIGENIRYNDTFKSSMKISNCNFYFSASNTYDLEACTGDILFDSCKFNYDISGLWKLINKANEEPYIKRLIFKNCLFNILNTATYLVSISDRYSHVSFIDCILKNDNITQGYFQANSGANTADNLSFNNCSLIGYDSSGHGGTSARVNNGFRLDVNVE